MALFINVLINEQLKRMVLLICLLLFFFFINLLNTNESNSSVIYNETFDESYLFLSFNFSAHDYTMQFMPIRYY